MIKKDLFIQQLISIAGLEQVKIDEPMKKHTTFRIGGNADYFVTPQDVESLQAIIVCCQEHNVEYFVMGNGSNLLVGDKGYRGAVIQLFRNFDKITVEDNRIIAQSGALLSAVANTALKEELTGFEFAAGIPGTIGGAVVMNAGAYDGEMKQVVAKVRVLDARGRIFELEKEELEMGYRTSRLQKECLIALEIVIELSRGSREAIRNRMDELKELRTSKQPLEFPSAGSTFKRPEGNYAGKLIMESGFRGYQVGGARVSDKHCGFVINAKDATASDVMELIGQIQDKVYEDSGIQLEMEIKKLGEF